MKKTKSKFIRRGFVILLILGGLAFFGWNVVFKKSNVNNRVSIYSDAILCVDYKNVRNTLLQNYLFDSTKNISSVLWKKMKSSGVETPSYFIAFTCTQKSKNTIFSSFEIEDTAKFREFIDSLLFQDDWISHKVENNQCVQSQKSKIELIYNLRKSILCVKYGKIDGMSQEITEDIINGTNLYSNSSILLTKFKNSKHHGLIWVTEGKYIAKESFLELNLEKGNLVLDGTLFFNTKYRFPEKTTSFYSTDSLSNFVFFNAGYSHWFKEILSAEHKEKFHKLTSINMDSLVSYSSQSFSLNLKGFFEANDTIISYSYDDNFNPIEKQELATSTHPDFELVIPTKDKKLFNYLREDSAVKQIGGKHVFVTYPFSKVYATYKNGVTLHTACDIKSKKSTNFSFVNVYLDYNKLDSNWLNSLGLECDLLKNKVIQFSATQKLESAKIKGSIAFY